MKKGFSSLIMMLIAIVIIIVVALVWFKMSGGNLQRTNEELRQMNNLVPSNTESQTQPQDVQGQLNNLRNSVNDVANKRDQEILEEMK